MELSCFFDDPTDVGDLISVSSAFSKTSLDICKLSICILSICNIFCKFTVHGLLKPGLENFEHYFASVWDECNCVAVWAFFGIAFLRDWNENWLFQSCDHCWVFQICWYIECSSFTASSFRIWNNLPGIPSPPLALFVVMLPKACLTLHSRMSGSRWVWVITASWLSGSGRSFLHSSVYSYHLFLISSASVRFIPFLSFIKLIFEWNVPLISLIFLKRSLVFTILLFSSVSLHWSLRKALSLLAILWNSAFKWEYLSFSPLLFTSLLFAAICKPSSAFRDRFCQCKHTQNCLCKIYKWQKNPMGYRKHFMLPAKSWKDLSMVSQNPNLSVKSLYYLQCIRKYYLKRQRKTRGKWGIHPCHPKQ